MSTRCTIATAKHTIVVGNEEYHSSVHVYRDCFDGDEGIEIEICQQGVFNNTTIVQYLPLNEAKQLAAGLAQWLKEQPK